MFRTQWTFQCSMLLVAWNRTFASPSGSSAHWSKKKKSRRQKSSAWLSPQHVLSGWAGAYSGLSWQEDEGPVGAVLLGSALSSALWWAILGGLRVGGFSRLYRNPDSLSFWLRWSLDSRLVMRTWRLVIMGQWFLECLTEIITGQIFELVSLNWVTVHVDALICRLYWVSFNIGKQVTNIIRKNHVPPL